MHRPHITPEPTADLGGGPGPGAASPATAGQRPSS